MLNFNFYNPTNILFGKGQLRELDKLVPRDSRVLVTYGGGSVIKNGTLDKVRAELGKSSLEVFEFGGIEPNPKFETLLKAVEVVRAEKVDFLLAVGGGSVMDGTKFIAIASGTDEFKGREEELLTFGFNPVPVAAATPMGTVVTLPATGSEMNCGGVISRGEDKLPVFSPHIFPRFSILDPELTFTLPVRQVANGVVDTFVHVVEQYMTFPSEARFQDRTSEGILQTMMEIGRTTIDNPTDYDARANLVWCATMGLNGLIGAGVPADWATHMIGHELTALFGIDHAQSLAVVLPAMWRVRREHKQEKLLQYGERVLGITSGSEAERVEGAIDRTELFFHSLGMKTRLSDYGIDEDGIERVIANLEKHGMTALSEHGDITLNVSREILRAAL
ncbi:MAG TPA: iron-containing alcohol dehydrogenase [Desulfomicrobiaceae bacterium]|nr:iron-containing alcohol dehydrogenase [Desulfomicrobiaceae bacterium]